MQAKSSESKGTPQANTSLASRIRWLLLQRGLQQQDLAAVMGVKVDRVKSLVLGRAQKLRADELERLQAAYGLSATWLVDGGPPWPPGWLGDGSAASANEAPGRPQAREPAKPYPQPASTADAALLQKVVGATAAAVSARGVQLTPERRLRLYWAVFELSIQAGEVNLAAIPPLLSLAESAG